MYTEESPILQSLNPLLHAYIIDSNQVVLKFFQAVSTINGQKIRQRQAATARAPAMELGGRNRDIFGLSVVIDGSPAGCGDEPSAGSRALAASAERENELNGSGRNRCAAPCVSVEAGAGGPSQRESTGIYRGGLDALRHGFDTLRKLSLPAVADGCRTPLLTVRSTLVA